MGCPKLSNELLLSWSSQKKLRTLHRNWPFTVLGQENVSTAQVTYTIPQSMKKCVSKKPLHTPVWPPEHFPEKLREVCKEYEDVLVDSLERNQTIQCPDMSVE